MIPFDVRCRSCGEPKSMGCLSDCPRKELTYEEHKAWLVRKIERAKRILRI